MTSTDALLVDARGHRCPVPGLRLRKALADAARGRVVRLLADDPMARIDVPHLVAEQGWTLLRTWAEGAWLAFDVVKPF
jgi:tRNA 2-thiouridine synthesizing protein A